MTRKNTPTPPETSRTIPNPTLVVGNLAEPIRFPKVELAGLAAESGVAKQAIKVLTRLAITLQESLRL